VNVRGVLCLHGFSGGPYELQPLAEALVMRGLLVSSPLLAGHGAGTRELAATTWHDWLQSGASTLAALVERTGAPVAIVGGSMGALLALRLARLHPEAIAGIVLLAPPLRLGTLEQRGIGALTAVADTLGLHQYASIPRPTAPDVTDVRVRDALPYAREYSLHALRSLLELQQIVGDDLGLIKAPALIVHGRRDRTVPLAVSDEVAARLGSLQIQRLWLDESGHLLALDVDRDRLAMAVTTFIATLAPDPAI
jgi:carboxylesterase